MPDSAGLDSGREALRRFLVGDDDLASMLTKISLIAIETIPDADFASITMIDRQGKPTTPVFTDKAALELDQVQYALDDGPCLAAVRHQGMEHCETATDTRWPTFSAAAADKGVREVMSTPLVDRETVKGALNLYSRSGFAPLATKTAARFADQLGVAAANAALYVEGALVAQQLETAMEFRSVIEQAKGILMGAQKCDEQAAFDILVRASQNRNRKLRDIASEIIERHTRQDSEVPPPPA
jgi:GAF domain-containing protein